MVSPPPLSFEKAHFEKTHIRGNGRPKHRKLLRTQASTIIPTAESEMSRANKTQTNGSILGQTKVEDEVSEKQSERSGPDFRGSERKLAEPVRAILGRSRSKSKIGHSHTRKVKSQNQRTDPRTSRPISIGSGIRAYHHVAPPE